MGHMVHLCFVIGNWLHIYILQYTSSSEICLSLSMSCLILSLLKYEHIPQTKNLLKGIAKLGPIHLKFILSSYISASKLVHVHFVEGKYKQDASTQHPKDIPFKMSTKI